MNRINKNDCVNVEYDLFGQPIQKDVILRDKFIEPPFSVIDTKKGEWQVRKNLWKRKGIKSEIGRDSAVIHMDTAAKEKNQIEYVSIFDPALCEVIYKWFCPENGDILDPFAGGSVRGIVANYLGFVPDTIRAFMDCGMNYYNEAILLNPIASASMRAEGNMKTKKLVKVHQNVLVFKKSS